jgi:hypothetical protein
MHSDEKGTTVNTTEHRAPKPPTATGPRARLRAFLRIPGRAASASASPRSHRRLTLAALPLAAALLLTLLSAPAQASTVCRGGQGAGACNAPEGLAVDQSSGDLYVADQNGRRIDQFDPSKPSGEQFVRAWGWGVRDGSEELQTCTEASGCLQGLTGSGPGQLALPQALAVEPSAPHDLYVVDPPNHRVQKFHLNPVTEEAEFVLMFGGEVDKGPLHPGNVCTAAYIAAGDTCGAGTTGTANGQFGPWPEGGPFQLGSGLIATGPAGVYVGDQGRIQEFDSSGNYTGQITLAATEKTLALAVNSAGDVYVIAGINERQRITPPASGTYTLSFKGSTTEPISFEAGDAEIESALFGITSGNTTVSAGGLVEFNHVYSYVNVPQMTASAGSVTTEVQGTPPTLRKLSPTGVPLQTLDASGEPTALAVNAADEVYVRDLDPAHGSTEVLAYDSSGAQTDLIAAPEIEAGAGHRSPGGLAFGQSAALLYLSDPIHFEVLSVPLPPPGPGVEAESVSESELLATRATLEAEINPKSRATTFHFEYVDQAGFEAHGFAECETPANPGCHKTPEHPLPGPVDFAGHRVKEAVTGLQAETAYRYRAVATNTKGTVDGPGAAFTTYPPVLFSPQAPTGLQPTAVTLHLDLNPEGLDTHYRFQYVTQQHFEAEGFANPASTPEAEVEATAFTPLSAAITELQPATAYRFRLLAENSASAGPLASADFPFETPPTVCPNQHLREEDNSLALPQCRAYEKVTPADKRGGSAHGIAAAPSGQRAVFGAKPDSAPDYLSRRTPDGWLSEHVDPPPSLGVRLKVPFANESLSEFLEPAFALGYTEADEAAGPPETAVPLLRGPDGTFSQAGALLHRPEGGDIKEAIDTETAVSADLSHAFLQGAAPLLATDSYPPGPPGGVSSHQRIYEVATESAAAPRPASVDPEGHVYQGCDAFGSTFAEDPVEGGGSGGLTLPPHLSHSEEVSRDGSVFFFTAWSPQLPESACAANHPSAYQLLARVNGAETVDLSQPQPSQCGSGPAPEEVSCRNAPVSSAAFAGASADGHRAFFVSYRQLTDDATQNQLNLYMYDFEKPAGERLTAVSAGDSSGLGPGVTGFLDVSADGSHVYYIAAGLLTEKRNALGAEAHPGAENVYVYDTETGRTSFVADLCPGAGASCPGSGSDFKNNHQFRLANESAAYDLTPDGRYLVFSTYAQLTPDDQNQARDVYRYDAQTETLIRVSTGHEAQDQNGNGGGQDAEFNVSSELLHAPHRIVSADGQTIVFATARPLQEGDENGNVDAYLWHQGQVDLLSGSQAKTGNGPDVTLSASGADVFFSTAAGLLPTDLDGLRDVYDARVDGGFPNPPLGRPPCESPEGCGRTAGPEPTPPACGSCSLIAPPPKPEKPCKKGFVKRHGHCVKVRKHHKHRHHHKRAGSNKGSGK